MSKVTLKKALHDRSVPNILFLLNEAIEVDDIKNYQDRLIASILSSIGFLASIMNFLFRWYWQDPMVENIVTSLCLLFFSGIMDYVVFSKSNFKSRTHLLSLSIVGLLLTISVSYYDRIGVILWTAIFLLLMISIIRIDQIVFSYIGASGIFISLYLFVFKLDDQIILNQLFFITQTGLFVVLLVIGLLWNKVYQNRFMKSHNQYLETVEQKEELSQLYEEIMATEEELRSQNERLHDYNTEIKENESRLNFMAYNDALTELPNRKLIIEKLEFLIDIAEENSTKFAVVFIDLDGFKKINDTMGHHVGDQYLIEVGKRLRKCAKSHDTVGRFGGDEFAVIVQNADKEDRLYEEVNLFRERICQTFEVDDFKIHSSASFGISIYPDDAREVDELIKSADAAMYKAKASGKNNIQFFRVEMKEEILKRIELEHELMDAYDEDEFFLVYQPQVQLESGEIEGFEALLRWQSPTRGVVSPMEFIPILEDMGLINEVGDWVLVESCRKIKELIETHHKGYYISINVSGHQMKDNHFVERVGEVIHTFGIDPGLLEIEITESIFIDDIEGAIKRINTLKEIGVSIALDDFGTGYSSLSYLRLLPIDVLKIDKSFIWDLEKGDKERKIVGSIIDLVHDMDISVVAEGVETDYQRSYLVGESCDHIQGYYISKPVSGKEVDAMLREVILK